MDSDSSSFLPVTDNIRMRAESPPIDRILTLEKVISDRCPSAPKKRMRTSFVENVDGNFCDSPPSGFYSYGGRLTPPTLLQPRKLNFHDVDTAINDTTSASTDEDDGEYRDGIPLTPPSIVNAYASIARPDTADSVIALLLPLRIGGQVDSLVVRRRHHHYDHSQGSNDEGRQPRNNDQRRRRD